MFSFTSLSYWMLLKLLTKLANPSQLYINCKSPSLLVQPPCIYRLPGHSPNQPMVESNLSRLPKSAPEKKQLKVCFSLLIKSINKYIYTINHRIPFDLKPTIWWFNSKSLCFMATAPPKKIVVKSKLSLFKEFVFLIILEMLCLYIYKTYISHFLLVQIIIFPHEHPPSSDVHLKELAARAPQTAAAGLGLGERQMFPQHLQGSRSKGASWKSYPICSMCGVFIYIWVILGQMVVNIPYMEHMGILL